MGRASPLYKLLLPPFHKNKPFRICTDFIVLLLKQERKRIKQLSMVNGMTHK